MGKEVLQDYLRPGLNVIICGTAVGTRSATRGHYYAGPGNEFWSLLHQSGLTPEALDPEDDARVVDFGIGLTDLAKRIAASSDIGLDDQYNVDEFLIKVERSAPRVVAFHGKKAAEVVSHHLGHGRKVRLGIQPWRLSESLVFVLPSASGANRDPNRLEGKADRVEWYRVLATLVGDEGGQVDTKAG
jgi:TDG/mug DNA glycosylase family protein